MNSASSAPVRIAILVDHKPLFASGIIQQALFTYRCLAQYPGHHVFFVSSNPGYTQFGMESGLFPELPVVTLTEHNLESVLAGVSVFLCLSSNINSDQPTLRRIKALGIKIVQNICGNYYVLDQERFAFGCHEGVSFYENSQYYDEYWLLPMYEFARSYIETMTRRPVVVVPYVWDSEIIDAWMTRTGTAKDIRWTGPASPGSVPPTLLIAEPNVSIHKTALVPLAICERYHLEGGPLATVICLSSKKGNASDRERDKIISGLQIAARGLVETYPRLVFPEVLHQLKALGKQPVLVSHQIMNDLNFLQLEMFYLGYPVVHNCDRLRDGGFHYDGCDIEAGAKQLASCVSLLSSVESASRFGNVRAVLWRYSPTNPDNVQAYADHVDRLLHSTLLPGHQASAP